MGALILPVNTASAHCKGNHKKDPECDTHVHDEPSGDASAINYTVKLTGAFEFGVYDPLAVTVESRGSVLRGAADVTLSRPDPATDWDAVFLECPNFFAPPMVDVPDFTAPSGPKGWNIGKPGGVQVNFNSIPFTVPDIGEVQVTLVLIGNTPFEEPFLPADPEEVGAINATEIEHEMVRFWIYGKSGRGVTPKHCNDGSEEGKGDLPLGSSILTITATKTK
jgi:hypothetical protein